MTGRRLLIALGGAFCLVILVRTAWLSELSYLTLRTIDHAAGGFGLRWNVNERVQVFDHPLWLLLLLGGRLLTGESYYTTLVLSIALSAATVVLVLRSASGPSGIVLGTVLLSTSWSFVTFATSGLEGPLAHLLIGLFCLVWLSQSGIRTSRRAAALAGAAGVTHPATLFITLPALVAAARPRNRDGAEPVSRGNPSREPGRTVDSANDVVREGPADAGQGNRPARAGHYGSPAKAGHYWEGWLLACGPLLAWGVFAAFYYGTPVPTPVIAEWTEHPGVPARVSAVGRLIAYILQHDPITLAVIAAGIALAWRRGGEHRGLSAGVAVYVLALAVWAGDGMPGRWLALPFVVSTLLVVAQPALERPAAFGAAIAAALALAAVPPLTTVRSDVRFGTPAERFGSRDPRAIDYRATGLLHDIRQWYPPMHPEARRGSVAWQDSNRVKTSPHPGFFGFAAGYGVHLIDVTGRTDPLLARMPPAGHPLFPSGAPREMPQGYDASLPNRANVIASPALAAYYDRVRLVTRGSLLDPWRLVAAAQLALEKPPADREGRPEGRRHDGGPPKRSAKAEGGDYRDHGPPKGGHYGDHGPPKGGHYGDHGPPEGGHYRDHGREARVR
jgi:arabinofuranosyltransferase